MGYSQEELDSFLSCEKQITQPPRKEMLQEHGHRRNDMKLESSDGMTRFSAFMRINEKFPENFSIGLHYIPEDGSGPVCLIRCNGPHQESSDDEALLDHSESSHHYGHHIHRGKADNIEEGRIPERGAEPTSSYASYQGALKFFLKQCNVKDWTRYFPNLDQGELFDIEMIK